MGDEFEDFVGARQRGLLRFAMVLTGDSRLAEEIVADVLGRAYEKWDRIGQLEQSNAYVRKMIVNEYLSWRRRLQRTAPSDDLEELAGEVPDHAVGHAERAALIGQLAQLPRKQRAALVLRFYEGLSDAEIARLLGCTESTVRSNAARALATLRIEMRSSTLNLAAVEEA